jgi:hypothetical protein
MFPKKPIFRYNPLNRTTPPPLTSPFSAVPGWPITLSPPLITPPLLPPRTYSLFVSHAWSYSIEYQRLTALLSKPDSGFSWRNLSIPQTNPVRPNPVLRRSYRRLIRELDARIQESDCLLVLSGMYCSHSEWIQSEIEAAQDFRKPIIAVMPLGQERIPQEVRTAAGDNIVGWRTESIIGAIKRIVL